MSWCSPRGDSLALALVISLAGVAVASTFAQHQPDPPQASEAPLAVAAEPISEAGVARIELPHLGTVATLGAGLVGLALLGRKRLA